ncbi:MAG: hypothetical protein M3Q23_05680 [Actinomycetota bacterium]|nr:hypothetical protein [Actinomycetota bacterium]
MPTKIDEAEERETARVLAALRDLWREVSGLDWHPKDQILRALLGRYDPWVVAEAVAATAPRVASGYLRDYAWRPYLWGVARRTVEQVEQQGPAGLPRGRKVEEEQT